MELILDYNEFAVYFDKEKKMFIYQDMEQMVEVEPIAKLTYDINNDVLINDLDFLFENFCCGEYVTDDRIIFLWFKEKEYDEKG